MATIRFTDSAIDRLKPSPKTAWYSDKTYKGLRLCVTKQGSKTWYAERWDSAAQKSRQVKIGQFPMMKRDEAWERACEAKRAVDRGEHKTRAEKRIADAMATTTPTLREAFEAFLEHRTGNRASGKRTMRDVTVKDYRSTFDCHLATWADVPIDQLPTARINDHLNALQLRHPYRANHAHAVIGATLRFAAKKFAVAVPVIPSLLDVTAPQPREIDREIDWADRWAEIEAVANPIKRACWQLRWHMGTRENVLRELTWDRVDLDAGTVTFERLKSSDKPRTVALSDYSRSVFERLHDMRHAEWVFPSVRRINGTLGHLDTLDRLPLTKPGDLRHLWNEAGMSLSIPYHLLRWLNGQQLKSGEIAMLGHYGVPDLESQRVAANRISTYIISRCGSGPQTVVELRRTGT